MNLNELLINACYEYDDCEICEVYYFDSAVIVVWKYDIYIEFPNYMEKYEWENPIAFIYSRENAPMDIITRIIYGV